MNHIAIDAARDFFNSLPGRDAILALLRRDRLPVGEGAAQHAGDRHLAAVRRVNRPMMRVSAEPLSPDIEKRVAQRIFYASDVGHRE